MTNLTGRFVVKVGGGIFVLSDEITRAMKMRFLILIIAVLFASSMQAQISRADLEKKTSKGLTLIQDGNFEGAISIFNEILSKDPTEGKALLLRARTKYELGAYKGAKKDCFAYMDVYGIDAEVSGILGKTEKAMENYKQALAYLKAALLFDPEGLEYLMDRAEIYYNLGLDEQACADWYAAVDAGSDTASRFIQKNCKRYKPKKEVVEIPEAPIQAEQKKKEDTDYTQNSPEEQEGDPDYTSNSENEEEATTESEEIPSESEESENTGSETETESNGTEYTESENTESTNTESSSDDEEQEESYPIDEKIEEIYVDEDLTIIIADGVGSRKLVEKPDILILSDKSGSVVVNVCVDRLGRVVNPTLNENMSTIQTPSLISLALRESSNFRFARSSRKSHCGTITYVITGSE